ncbi:MAG: MFS transporter [Acidimicrobiales bacterium]|nr:MFS transporter [Acidimicrobiales bacterium]
MLDPRTAPLKTTSFRKLVRTVFSRGPAQRTLHLTWFAFFLTFVVWFGFAPFAGTIGDQFGLGNAELVTLSLCNLALTVPARLLIGGILDRIGPRRTFTAILVFAAFATLLFASAQDFTTLVVSRLLISVAGAGFVVGIRMVSEWFPPAEVGTAEGVYGGWGNFGAAAAALGLPVIADAMGGPDGWRWANVVIGVLAGAYGLAYARLVADTPDGVPFRPSRRVAALEVTSQRAVVVLVAMMIPPAVAMGVIAWRVFSVGVIGAAGLSATLVLVGLWFVAQVVAITKVNRWALGSRSPETPAYPFRSAAILALAYACTFGSELAAVSYLPQFFENTWGLSATAAGAAASVFAVMNLVSRPAGGLISDLVRSRRAWLATLLGCLALGYLAMASLTSAWPLALALCLVLVTSLFAQAGNGAVFAIVPLVRPNAAGQVAGLAGAYGNVGGIVFLATLLFVTPQRFFLVMAAAAALVFVACRFLVEPSNGHDGAPSLSSPGCNETDHPSVLRIRDLEGDGELVSPVDAVDRDDRCPQPLLAGVSTTGKD